MRRAPAAVALLGLATVVVGAPACARGGGGRGFSPEPPRPERFAWIGVRADGAHVVVEPMTPPTHAEYAVVEEEAMLRSAFGLDERHRLLRVHEIGAPPERAPGSVRTPDGGVLDPLAAKPEGLDARQRLLWEAIAAGGRGALPAELPLERRSYLVAGRDVGAAKPDTLTWTQEGSTMELTQRSWTERERRDYLAAAAAPASDAGESDHE